MVQLGIRQVEVCISKLRKFKARNDCHRRKEHSSDSDRIYERGDRTFATRIFGSGRRRPFVFRFGHRGFSTLGGCLALLSAVTGFGLYRIIDDVHTLAKTQIALDRCSGQFALHLRAAAYSMESSYERVELYRLVAAAACETIYGCPAALNILNIALNAEKGIETAIKIYWDEQKVIWNTELSNRCDLGTFAFFSIQKSTFPDFPYEVIKPEEGLAVHEGTEGLLNKPDDLVLRIQKRNLVSEATASREAVHEWRVRWSE
jgi:hypothetical protein